MCVLIPFKWTVLLFVCIENDFYRSMCGFWLSRNTSILPPLINGVKIGRRLFTSAGDDNKLFVGAVIYINTRWDSWTHNFDSLSKNDCSSSCLLIFMILPFSYVIFRISIMFHVNFAMSWLMILKILHAELLGYSLCDCVSFFVKCRHLYIHTKHTHIFRSKPTRKMLPE